MIQTRQAERITLYEFVQKFNLQLIEDFKFFPEMICR